MRISVTAGVPELFNESWQFALGEKADAHAVDYDDSSWRTLNLPHDWAVEGPFAEEFGPRCGGLPYFGTGWYRKHFDLPIDSKDKTVKIHFDGAMANAEVWINGTRVGERPYGYISFMFDISPYVIRGGENVIAVKLSPEILSSRWYPGAGLYRNVYLEIDEPVHLAHWGTTITTPHIGKESAAVQVETRVENKLKESRKVKVAVQIINRDERVVTESVKKVKISGGKEKTVRQTLDVENPMLWNIDDPCLYQVKTEVRMNGQVIDAQTDALGFRTVEFSAENGLLLNGEKVRIQGVCMHHDLGPLGAAVNRRATVRQLEIMKTMGVNSIRTAHNPPSREQLDACDKLGILVQVEAFDCWQIAKVENGYNKHFDEWYETDLRAMIRRDKNHPSVIMWSIGNEILEQRLDDGWKLTRELAEICREEDPARPVTAGFNYYPNPIKNGMAAEIDIVGFNYHPASYGEVLEQHPEWILIGSETSSCLSSRGVYHFPIEPYDKHPSHQLTSYDLIGPPWAYPPDMEFHFLEKNPKVLGEYVWTGFDYLGEPTPYGGRDNHTRGGWKGDWPSRSSYFGIVDLCGFPKDRFYLYQSQWTDKPMIHLLPHWNWEGMEGDTIPVYSYTNCDEAELFVNGKSFGKRIKGVDTTPIYVDLYNWKGGETFDTPYRLRWDVPYKAGEIKVVGFVDGKAEVEKVVHTAGQAAQIELTADRPVIHADGGDLSFITVRVLDEDGNLCPTAEDMIWFTLDGPGEIRAVGNGNPATTLAFQAAYRPAFNGLCMVIVKGSGEPGRFSVTAKSDFLTSETVQIETIE